MNTDDIIEVQVPARMALSALHHMLTMCPENYEVHYQRERIVRVEHTGGKILYIAEDSGTYYGVIEYPVQFASFCNNLVVQRLTGREGSDLLHMEVIPIDVWLTLGSVQ